MATIPRYVSLRDLPVFLFLGLGLLLLLDLWLCLIFFDLITILSLWRPARGAGVISVSILLLLIVLLGIPATRETPSMIHMLGPTCDAKNHGWLIYWCPDLGFVCSGFRTPQVYATVCCNTIELWEIWALSTFLNKQETRRSHSSLLLRLWYTTWDGNKRENNIILIGLSWMPIPNLIIDWLGFQKVKVPGAFHRWSHLPALWPTHHCTNHSVCQLQRCPCSRCQRTCRLLPGGGWMGNQQLG